MRRCSTLVAFVEEKKRSCAPLPRKAPLWISIGIFARNEESVIGRTLRALLNQTLFTELTSRKINCEVLLLANGCNDGTSRISEGVFASERDNHPCVLFRVVDLPVPGKFNAWNQFTHSLSSKEARFLFMMDADILIHCRETLSNMLRLLETDPEAQVAVDLPLKTVAPGQKRDLRDRLSAGAAAMTQSAPAQLCGQLYCIRAEVARNIYLPRDLSACEDGFIKALVCTDFGTRTMMPGRIRLAPRAEHTFEPYRRPAEILRNQKRQVIGQTIVHILIDQWLPELPIPDRQRLGEVVRSKDEAEPDWLRRRIDKHLARARWPWRLYPGLASIRFRRLANLEKTRRWTCLPAALIGTVTTYAASFLAWRFLRRGATHYWPQPSRTRIETLASKNAL